MTIASPFPDVQIPELSVYDFVFGTVEAADQDSIAIVDSARAAQTSYQELIAGINAFAGALAQRGVGAGQVVALFAPNSLHFAIAFHAILRAGATATPINALYRESEVAAQLVDSGATTLITIAALLDCAKSAAAQSDLADSQIIVLDGPGLADCGYANAEDLISAGCPVPHVEFDPATHVAVLPYSSGTTGRPKGVMLTHRNLVANLAQIAPGQDLRSDDVVIAVVPLFHIYGLAMLNATLRARARLVTMPAFELSVFLDAIDRYGCTFGVIAPPVAVALAKHPIVDSYSLSSLTTMVSAAAPLDAALGNAVAERIGCRVLQAYGMTELSPASHITPRDGGQGSVGVVAPLLSCGWGVPNLVTKIVDVNSGAEIARPEEGLSAAGELRVKGPNVMMGYHHNEEATRDTFDADGFLQTGDLARVDAAGCVYIVDRLKELIKYKGYQVPPAELEAVLLTHPEIVDAAVIGVADDEAGGEVPKAFVVKKTNATLAAPDVMSFVACRVAPYKKIRHVEFIEQIPKSAAGKILRANLRSR
jgi:acyl-CoA synthetase (AMP-forming)/AMP-acid ligase II